MAWILSIAHIETSVGAVSTATRVAKGTVDANGCLFGVYSFCKNIEALKTFDKSLKRNHDL